METVACSNVCKNTSNFLTCSLHYCRHTYRTCIVLCVKLIIITYWSKTVIHSIVHGFITKQMVAYNMSKERNGIKYKSDVCLPGPFLDSCGRRFIAQTSGEPNQGFYKSHFNFCALLLLVLANQVYATSRLGYNKNLPTKRIKGVLIKIIKIKTF